MDERRTGPRVAAFNCPNCGAAVGHDAVSCRYCGSSIATRVCPACFGAVAIGMRHCPHCGAQAADGESKTVDLHCPRCEETLSEVAVGKHSLSQCLQCGGVWADKESFQDICVHEQEQEAVLGFEVQPETPSRSESSKPRRTYVPCPHCGKLMNHKNFSGCSGVVIDWCREHGTWFDRRELQDIVAFIRNGGLRKAREREQTNLKDRERELRMKEFQAAALDRSANSPLASDLDLEGNRSSLLELFCSALFR